MDHRSDPLQCSTARSNRRLHPDASGADAEKRLLDAKGRVLDGENKVSGHCLRRI